MRHGSGGHRAACGQEVSMCVSFDGLMGTGGDILHAFRRCKSLMIPTLVSSTHLALDENRNKSAKGA